MEDFLYFIPVNDNKPPKKRHKKPVCELYYLDDWRPTSAGKLTCLGCGHSAYYSWPTERGYSETDCRRCQNNLLFEK